MFLVLLAGLIATPILERTVFHHDNVFRESRYISALHIAEGGIEETVWHLTSDDQNAWSGWNTIDPDLYIQSKKTQYDPEGHQLGEYEVNVVGPDPTGLSVDVGPLGVPVPFRLTTTGSPIITAVAGVPDLTSPGSEIRIVQVEADMRTTGSLGLFSDLDLDFNGNTGVDSYDSRLGPYDPITNRFANATAGTNNDIVMNNANGGNIEGDAYAVGTISFPGNITGEAQEGVSVIDLPPVDDVVAAAALENDNGDIPQAIKNGGQQYDAVDLSDDSLNLQSNSTLTLPGGTKENPKIYYFSNVKSHGDLYIDGYVIIFTDGNVNLNGGTILNGAGGGKTEQLLLVSSGDLNTEIKINGGGGFAGVIYAPGAYLRFGGGCDIFGSAVGGDIDFLGNAQFHYDEALGDAGVPVSFELTKWVEKAPS